MFLSHLCVIKQSSEAVLYQLYIYIFTTEQFKSARLCVKILIIIRIISYLTRSMMTKVVQTI